ncbi:MAG: aminotransferase class I/II-fold pyridoxal phosphate-dependent enzyme, partial [Oscillospiraceae bacterium]|nr:aminotransferase class I/II-fold pyridoxal phosphate-dependent enzyme [Oscillospiraceae bacterium]
NPYNLSAITIAAASAAIADTEYYAERIATINATRERATAALTQLGFVCTNSQANFIFATHPKISGEELYNALREQKILVRHFALPRISNHVRISVGTEEEMGALLEAVRVSLSVEG